MEGKDLVTAIAENNKRLVEKLLDAGADVNKISRNGFAPLCIAAFWDSSDIVKLLMKHNADVNVRNNGTLWTPMHCAAFQGHGRVIMFLMENKPDLTLADSLGRTAVDFASTTEKIWGFFANEGCERSSKQALIDKGVITKVDAPPPSKSPDPDADADPFLAGNSGMTYSSYSRPGSAYVMRNMSAAQSRPATAMSRPGSNTGSRCNSREGSDNEGEISAGMGRMGLIDKPDKLAVDQAALHRARTGGDVLAGVPSPVAEGIEQNSPKNNRGFGGVYH